MTERAWRAVSLLPSLHGYQGRFLGPDAIAALTLLVIAVPEQLATSRLAGMPPVTGLFAFVAGTVLFALAGSNPQMSVGADSTIAPLFAAALSHLAPTASPDYVALAGVLAVLVGAMVAAVGLLRLGWISEFLSMPIITGFLAGVAVIIVVHQLPDVLGLPATGGSTVHRVASVLSHLGHANGWTVGIAAVVLALVVAAERIDRRLPGALVGLVGSTVLVAVAQLHGHGVAVLGEVAHHAPHLGLRQLSWANVGKLMPVAGVVALVVISQSAATSSAFADQGDYDVDIGRDFVGVGLGCVAAGVTGSFPVDASPARTAAVAAAGGRTQVSGLLAAGTMVVLIPAAGLLRDVPVATLGAVLLFIAARLFHVADLRTMARFDLVEFALAVVTMLTVALAGVEQGIGLAVGLAILDRTRRSARPKVHRMGRIPGTTSWEPDERRPDVEQVAGVVVLLFAAPLYYANAAHFRAQVEQAVRAESGVTALVLDAVGMHDVDYTGSRVVARLLDELGRRQVRIGFARAGETLRRNLARSGQLARIGADHFYDSVDAAVVALAPGQRSS